MSGVAMVKKLREIGRTDFIGKADFLRHMNNIVDESP